MTVKNRLACHDATLSTGTWYSRRAELPDTVTRDLPRQHLFPLCLRQNNREPDELPILDIDPAPWIPPTLADESPEADPVAWFARLMLDVLVRLGWDPAPAHTEDDELARCNTPVADFVLDDMLGVHPSEPRGWATGHAIPRPTDGARLFALIGLDRAALHAALGPTRFPTMVREAREGIRLTPRHVASRTPRCSAKDILGYEDGTRFPRYGLLAHLSEALHLPHRRLALAWLASRIDTWPDLTTPPAPLDPHASVTITDDEGRVHTLPTGATWVDLFTTLARADRDLRDWTWGLNDASDYVHWTVPRPGHFDEEHHRPGLGDIVVLPASQQDRSGYAAAADEDLYWQQYSVTDDTPVAAILAPGAQARMYYRIRWESRSALTVTRLDRDL